MNKTKKIKGRKPQTVKTKKGVKPKKEVLKHQIGLDSHKGNLPMGVACVVEVTELDDGEKVKGHIIELDCVAVGRKVHVRLNRDATIAVFIEDGSGTEKVYAGQRGDINDYWHDRRPTT